MYRVGKPLLRETGLTLSQVNERYVQQAGLCGVCKQDRDLVVDHEHRGKFARGLICRNCNAVLGLVRDSPGLLRDLASYLESQPAHWPPATEDLADAFRRKPRGPHKVWV